MVESVDFINESVLSAQDPSPYGYHHGPIPTGTSAAISRVNTQVCGVVVDASQRMCGKVFSDRPGVGQTRCPTSNDPQADHVQYYRHLRTEHPGCVTMPSRSQVKADEKLAGENAIRHFVLTGGWRDARYLYEPGQGPGNSLVRRYANELEQLASKDAVFRLQYGEKFHRQKERGVNNRRISYKFPTRTVPPLPQPQSETSSASTYVTSTFAKK
ncbi:hypothetical protein HJFPF1_11668 [Paramyrothecium foliicola]|nr:hypothetical protein HJFPF1_11668 [Paramyrothecium foliicola]